MHSHLARKHGCPVAKSARPKAKAYTQHATRRPPPWHAEPRWQGNRLGLGIRAGFLRTESMPFFPHGIIFDGIHDKLLKCLDVLEKGCSNPRTLLRFKSTHKLEQAYSGALKMLGLRLRPERVQQSTAAGELTEAYLGAPFTDWTRPQPQNWTKPAALGEKQG
ncbi:unnamed protein product [Symbiodinium microadriaticum]|nr:unnamed protein product [Symbiodinium microadriaticum]CAE7879462.1 unnamed protein product [Symbiodinium sp. KB8]